MYSQEGGWQKYPGYDCLHSADINVIGLVGERGREVREFMRTTSGRKGLESVVVVATSDQPALVRQSASWLPP